MNKNNEIIAKKMTDVNYCVAELAQRGLSITSIEIKDQKPVIKINSYGKSPAGLKGGVVVRISHRGRHFETYAVELEGCQVQWKTAS